MVPESAIASRNWLISSILLIILIIGLVFVADWFYFQPRMSAAAEVEPIVAVVTVDGNRRDLSAAMDDLARGGFGMLRKFAPWPLSPDAIERGVDRPFARVKTWLLFEDKH